MALQPVRNCPVLAWILTATCCCPWEIAFSGPQFPHLHSRRLCSALPALTPEDLESSRGGWKGNRVLWLTIREVCVLCCLRAFSPPQAWGWTGHQPALIRGLGLIQPEGAPPPRGGEGPPDGWLVSTQVKLLRERRCAESAPQPPGTRAPWPPEPAR